MADKRTTADSLSTKEWWSHQQQQQQQQPPLPAVFIYLSVNMAQLRRPCHNTGKAGHLNNADGDRALNHAIFWNGCCLTDFVVDVGIGVDVEVDDADVDVDIDILHHSNWSQIVWGLTNTFYVK